jgi:hypothetical protein
VIDYQATDLYLQYDLEVRLTSANYTRGSL